MEVRKPVGADELAQIRELNRLAFAKDGGTRAFDELRESGRPDLVSLVATDGTCILGHVLFTPVDIDTPSGTTHGMGLGELAVLPTHQRTGIGTRLTETGTAILRELGCPFVIVVGHASYYPRFGFEPGVQHGISCQWEGIPDDAFMVLVLDDQRMQGVSGVARYTDPF